MKTIKAFLLKERVYLRSLFIIWGVVSIILYGFWTKIMVRQIDQTLIPFHTMILVVIAVVLKSKSKKQGE